MKTVESCRNALELNTLALEIEQEVATKDKRIIELEGNYSLALKTISKLQKDIRSIIIPKVNGPRTPVEKEIKLIKRSERHTKDLI